LDFKLIIDKEHKEEVIVYAKAETQLVNSIKELVLSETQLVAFKGDEIIKISPNDVYCFTIEKNKLYAVMENEKLQIKKRLYQIEESLGNTFVKINQSSIANIKKIDRFSVSIGGALMVKFKNGYRDFVSRRQVKFVKERMGI